MPLPDERIAEIISQVEAEQALVREGSSFCMCCDTPLGKRVDVPTECASCANVTLSLGAP